MTHTNELTRRHWFYSFNLEYEYVNRVAINTINNFVDSVINEWVEYDENKTNFERYYFNELITKYADYLNHFTFDQLTNYRYEIRDCWFSVLDSIIKARHL